ncbi:MAG: STN domain-containing protein, partial [Methanococcaceae archaeon]
MKLSCYHLLLFISLIFLSLFPYCSFGQSVKLNEKISFSVNNVPVSDALESLTRLTGDAFSYNPDQLPANKIVKIDIHNQPLIDVLNAILGTSGFGYRQMGNQIIIYRNKEQDTPNVIEPENTNKDRPDAEKKNPVPVKNSITSPVKPDTIIRE